MPSRISPRIVVGVGMCALLTSLAAPLAQAQTYNDRRLGTPDDLRRGAEELQQRRALETMRQSLEAQARARATEDRQRELKQQTDQLSKPIR